MDWMKKHTDTVIILAAFAGCLLWMNGKFNDVDKRFFKVDAEILCVRNDMNQRFSEVEAKINQRFSEVDKEIAIINKEIAIVKAVMILKNVMPAELAKSPEKE